jgi:transposase
MHALCTRKCRPLSIVTTPGNVNDHKAVEEVLDSVRVLCCGKGRPRKKPDCLLADKGYTYPVCRAVLRQRGIRAVIPERKDEQENRKRKGQKGGRPHAFDREVYKERNVVERTFLRLKQWRRIATRYDKEDDAYLAFLSLATILLWLH